MTNAWNSGQMPEIPEPEYKTCDRCHEELNIACAALCMQCEAPLTDHENCVGNCVMCFGCEQFYCSECAAKWTATVLRKDAPLASDDDTNVHDKGILVRICSYLCDKEL